MRSPKVPEYYAHLVLAQLVPRPSWAKNPYLYEARLESGERVLCHSEAQSAGGFLHPGRWVLLQVRDGLRLSKYTILELYADGWCGVSTTHAELLAKAWLQQYGVVRRCNKKDPVYVDFFVENLNWWVEVKNVTLSMFVTPAGRIGTYPTQPKKMLTGSSTEWVPRTVRQVSNLIAHQKTAKCTLLFIDQTNAISLVLNPCFSKLLDLVRTNQLNTICLSRRVSSQGLKTLVEIPLVCTFDIF